jgi:hypothetical protein
VSITQLFLHRKSAQKGIYLPQKAAQKVNRPI